MDVLLDRLTAWLAKHRAVAVPAALLGMVGVLLVPMGPSAMDALVAINFALAVLVLVRAAGVRRPLEFSVFPALLLGTTLLRLVVNVASTRLILSADAPTPADARGVAGQLIESCGRLVAADSVAVGATIFAILVLVQFVVVTKGASRMAEVAARFALDALPGRQVAIDADLASGAIDARGARRRRDELAREADFFGAMDGASRFVRGDAVAGLLITAINVVGGILVGTLERGWGLGDTVRTFTVLAIGDGLAAQVPAFIVAVASGLVMARAGRGRTVGEELPRQLAGGPRALWGLAVFLAVLAATPLPTAPLVTGAAVVAAGAWIVGRNARISTASPIRERAPARAMRERVPEMNAAEARVQAIGALLSVEPIEVEVGAALLPLVRDGESSPLLRRIEAVRTQVAQDLGIVVPPVRVRDDRTLSSGGYRIRIRGAAVGEGELRLGELLAMPGDGTLPRLPGIAVREPAFGLDALWIAPSIRPQAESMGCAVATPESVLGAHFATVVRRHADELLTREHVADLLGELSKRAPRLVADTVPACIRSGELQRVMQCLLRERVPVRDLEAVLEAVADASRRSRDPGTLAEAARRALRRSICQQYVRPNEDGQPVLTCIAAGPRLDAEVAAAVREGDGEPVLALHPDRAVRIVRAIAAAAQPLAEAGLPVVVLASPGTRAALARLVAPHIPGSAVLCYDELVRGIDVERVADAEVDSLEAEAAA